MAKETRKEKGAPTAQKTPQNKQALDGVRTLLFLVIMLATYLLLWQLLTAFFDFPVYYYGRLIEVLSLCLFAALALTTDMDFEKMGVIVPRKTLFCSLALGLLLALGFVAALALTRVLADDKLEFFWHIRGDIARATYILVAPFQEVLGKSVMLYSFERVLGEEHRGGANLLCALAFGAFHVVYGIKMMLMAMALSLVTGLLFQKYRCVWGCAVTHFACGFFPLCFGFV